MSSPYVGEIRIFAGNFPPAGWMFCDGQLLPISEYDTLFNLIGTTYGGDGQSTFALPDLRGRLPVHMGTNPSTGTTYTIGENGGVETVTLTTQQTPTHTHAFVASTNLAGTASPANSLLASLNLAGSLLYVPAAGAATLNANSVTSTGGNQPHDNLQPYLCVDFIISLFGIYPSPT